MQKLTSKQKDILEIIREYINQKKENPTSYRIHKDLVSNGSKDSLKSVMQVIEALEKKELIKRDENKKIYVIENDSYANLKNIFSVPVYGLASCGDALAYAEDNVDGFLQISKSLFRGSNSAQLFAVKTLGDSMDKENINDGDYAIFEKYDYASGKELEGKIVVAVINGMATIKRYKKVSNEIIGLFPHSTNNFHQPIFIHKTDSILIAGIFKKVLPVKYVSL
ncbi:MAG TPA: S24 family peptidase [Candidatus Moranbacteria bacterium]|nr:S24 family peptidase [Candidatus Moranbacteria bacterium]